MGNCNACACEKEEVYTADSNFALKMVRENEEDKKSRSQ